MLSGYSLWGYVTICQQILSGYSLIWGYITICQQISSYN